MGSEMCIRDRNDLHTLSVGPPYAKLPVPFCFLKHSTMTVRRSGLQSTEFIFSACGPGRRCKLDRVYNLLKVNYGRLFQGVLVGDIHDRTALPNSHYHRCLTGIYVYVTTVN